MSSSADRACGHPGRQRQVGGGEGLVVKGEPERVTGRGSGRCQPDRRENPRVTEARTELEITGLLREP